MTTEEIIFYSLIAIIVILILWVVRLEVKIKNIPSIKLNHDLNNKINIIQQTLVEVDKFKNKTADHFDVIDNELKKTIKGIETIRFNPFKGGGIGGNQSFATALIDDNGNGIVLSSLYSRERVSVFAKPIKNWVCEYEMSGEEKEALNKARAAK